MECCEYGTCIIKLFTGQFKTFRNKLACLTVINLQPSLIFVGKAVSVNIRRELRKGLHSGKLQSFIQWHKKLSVRIRCLSGVTKGGL